MTEKEKAMQSALGTMKRQIFVSADWKDFERAFKNFGLFMYEDLNLEGTGTYGFIISNEQLTDEQIVKLCENYVGDEDDEN